MNSILWISVSLIVVAVPTALFVINYISKNRKEEERKPTGLGKGYEIDYYA